MYLSHLDYVTDHFADYVAIATVRPRQCMLRPDIVGRRKTLHTKYYYGGNLVHTADSDHNSASSGLDRLDLLINYYW